MAQRMRTCFQCKIPRPLDEFHRSARENEGRSYECKKCRKERESGRDHYMKTYGVTKEWVENMFDEQNRECAVCHILIANLGEGRLDHCHGTKIIRGILCHNCNVAAGHLKDNLTIVSSLMMYLGRVA